MASRWRGDEPIVLEGHEDNPCRLISPEATSTASPDKTARIWRADGRGGPVVLKATDRRNPCHLQSRWANRSAASRDGTARVWRADGVGEPVVLPTVNVNHTVFSPQYVVTASGDGATAAWKNTARVWRADGKGMPIILRGHTGPLTQAVFSPDGRYIVTASSDTARVWRADGVGEPIVRGPHRIRDSCRL